MKRTIWKTLAGMVAMALLLSACVRPDPSGLSSAALQQTAIIETITSRLTEQALETVVAQATERVLPAQTSAPPTDTSAPVLPTETSVPPATQVPPTHTPVVPTSTAVVATSIPTVPVTPIVSPTDWAQFVQDVSTADGTTLTAGSKFTKTWRIKNIGTSTWTTSYALVFYSGNSMSGKASYPLPTNVRPGETIDLSIELTAPTAAGNHKGYWMLRNAAGTLFGIGNQANGSLSVSINVTTYRSDVIPASIYPYDFTSALCSARWLHNYNKITLPCSGFDENQATWAAVLMNPIFENGHKDDERTIWFHLDGKNEGWLQGVFTPYTVKAGDRFRAWIGCLDGSKNCNVVFSLDYIVGDGKLVNLGKWEQTYDDKIDKLDIDLSFLAGKDVKFLLGVTNKSSSAADVFWFVPSIQNFPPTATATATATATPTPTQIFTSTATEEPTATPTETQESSG